MRAFDANSLRINELRRYAAQLMRRQPGESAEQSEALEEPVYLPISQNETSAMRHFFTLWFLSLSLMASAETYRGISPLDSLGDVKARLPGATFMRLNPAWATNLNVLYKITGNGLSGSIVIMFSDNRPSYREMAETTPSLQTDQFHQKLINMSDEDALTVNWVRWVPDTAFPLQRLVAKYGLAEKSGFSNEDYQPYRYWPTKGLTAYLSDDEKNVVRIDYIFTTDEEVIAWQTKWGILPPWLKVKKESTRAKPPR